MYSLLRCLLLAGYPQRLLSTYFKVKCSTLGTMKPFRYKYRTPEALWRVVRRLDPGAHRSMLIRLKQNRLGWLYRVLREMPEYDPKGLQARFLKDFPETKVSLLRVYKRQLWDVLEAHLAELAGQRDETWRAYRRMMAAFSLWWQGEYEIAFVLWQQAMKMAVEEGAYEVALLGISFLELYARDLHWLGASENLEAWLRQILTLLQSRYEGLSHKFKALEDYIPSRGRTLRLPPLPHADPWAQYFAHYAQVFQTVMAGRFLEALRELISMTEILIGLSGRYWYQRFHLAIVWNNILIMLLNVRAKEGFEVLYDLWDEAWQRGFFPAEERFRALYRLGLSTRLARYMQTGAWVEGYHFLLRYWEEMHEVVFRSVENVGLRFGVAVACGWFLLQMNDRKRFRDWLAQVEDWISPQKLEGEIERLWHEILLWYAAYIDGQKRIPPYQVYRLYQLWRRYHEQDRRWIRLLRVLRLMSSGHWERAAFHARLLIQRDIEKWNPEASVFPVIPLVRAISRGPHLFPIQPEGVRLEPLPQTLGFGALQTKLRLYILGR